MNKKEKYKILDLLLSKFKDGALTSELSQEVKIDFHIVHSLSKDLLENDYLTNYQEIAIKDPKYYGDFIARTSQKGLYFLKVEGGFNSKYKKDMLKKSWTISKTIAAVANAIIIICISIWAIIESKKSSKLENRIIELENKFSEQKTNQVPFNTLKTDSLIKTIEPVNKNTDSKESY